MIEKILRGERTFDFWKEIIKKLIFFILIVLPWVVTIGFVLYGSFISKNTQFWQEYAAIGFLPLVSLCYGVPIYGVTLVVLYLIEKYVSSKTKNLTK